MHKKGTQKVPIHRSRFRVVYVISITLSLFAYSAYFSCNGLRSLRSQRSALQAVARIHIIWNYR